MRNLKIRLFIILASTIFLFLSQSALATTAMNSIGTGSTSSYSYGESKTEGSKSKTLPQHISGSKRHYKSEGSRSKSYLHGKNHHGSKSGHGYNHRKSEGSGSKSYSHGKSHHGYKKSYGKSHGHKTSTHGGHGGHGKHGSSPFKHVMRYKYKLGLTDSQIATMKKQDVEFKKKIIQAKADHEKAHLELDLQVHSGEVNEAKIRAAGAKIVASKTDKIMAMIEAKIQLLKLLTAEQRQNMAKMH
ncbi:MAG: hypothetical protein F3741_12295 [Nitrospinae bacterium]|nr:hypothetical protein [Nitrospinota bacterium]MZH41936.1 hypothetical protein [Nitrospinota bacterium]